MRFGNHSPSYQTSIFQIELDFILVTTFIIANKQVKVIGEQGKFTLNKKNIITGNKTNNW